MYVPASPPPTQRRRSLLARRPARLGAYGALPLATVASIIPGGIFKKGSPRYKGGPLMGTVRKFQQRVESGELAVIRQMADLRQGIGTSKKHTPGWAGVWSDLLPNWSYNAAQYAAIKRADPGFRGPPPAGAVAAPAAPAAPAVPPPITQPQITPPITTVTPAGPVVTPAVPAPTVPPPSGGEAYIPPTPGAEEPPPEEPKKAGIGGVPLLLAGGLVLFALVPKRKGRRR